MRERPAAARLTTFGHLTLRGRFPADPNGFVQPRGASTEAA